MVISFTGHRDRAVKDSTLQEIFDQYKDSEWVHGGAKGFDSQVNMFANNKAIKTTILTPDYKNKGRAAPLIRDREIVDRCDILFACYDGRKNGGTFYTIQYARAKGKEVHILSPQ
jgi:hypothetical protein